MIKLKQFLAASAIAACSAFFLLPQGKAQKAETRTGSFEKIKVHGKSLEGNLEGDSPDRDVLIYLPPSYASSPNRRYPVVYFLHGYGARAETYWNSLSVPAAADAAVTDGSSREMILVLPDAHTIYDGSMFSSSLTTGDWESFVAEDLVAYIDGHYRTIANRSARGLAGHSMGGYGTVRIGMKRSDAFSVLYAMSSCCLMNNPQQLLPGVPRRGSKPLPAQPRPRKSRRREAARWQTRSPRRLLHGRPIHRILRSSLTCPLRTAKSCRSSRPSG